ncbi:MAG TPA: BrnT family toxin [Thermoanaerobaculia bacterium]|nr:BrnT family toxin [Thermoanaerobaculia bacterium]
MTSLHNRAYCPDMDYEWDEDKARTNLAKHGVDFAEAALVLEDELALTAEDLSPHNERRFVTLGADEAGRLLVVVWTPRTDRARLISARKATAKERRRYEGGE